MPVDLTNAPVPGRRSIMGQYRVSLFAPASRAPVSLTDDETADASYEATARYIGVPAAYQTTPEMADTAIIGLTKENSILVSDRWWFLAEQEIDDAWLIVLTGCINPKHPYIGRCWIAQGNSEVVASLGRRTPDRCWVYAKLSPTSLIPTGS